MAEETKPVEECDDLAAKLEKHVARAVNYVVSRLSRDEMPDDMGQVALALASGETCASLCEKAKGKVERRTAKAAEIAGAHAPVPPVPAPVEAKPEAEPESVDEPKKGDGYDDCTLEELRHEATSHQIEGRSGMDKAQLIKALRAADKKAAK